MTRVRRRRGRPSTTPSRSTKQTASPARFGMRDARAQPAGDEREMRVGVARLDRALHRVEIVAAIEPVVLVAGALGKERPEGVDVGGDVLRAQPRRDAAIEETGRRVGRPVQAVGITGERFVFRGEPGPQLDDVEARLRSHLKREIQRFGRHAM